MAGLSGPHLAIRPLASVLASGDFRSCSTSPGGPAPLRRVLTRPGTSVVTLPSPQDMCTDTITFVARYLSHRPAGGPIQQQPGMPGEARQIGDFLERCHGQEDRRRLELRFD